MQFYFNQEKKGKNLTTEILSKSYQFISNRKKKNDNMELMNSTFNKYVFKYNL